MFRWLFVATIILLLTSCSNDAINKVTSFSVSIITNILKGSEVFQENIINLHKLDFINEKEMELIGEGKVICKLIAYESVIVENSEKSKNYDKTSIVIKYPEFIYVTKKDNGFHHDAINYTKTINHLIKAKAMGIYTKEYGVYFSGLNSITDYAIKLLDNEYLSILFGTVTVEGTKYSDYYAINIDLRKDELYEPLRYAIDMDEVGTNAALKLSDFISKEEALEHANNDNYKIYFRNQEITDVSEKHRIILALKDNIDYYFQRLDKFYITKESIGFICDEVAHKGESYEVLIPR